MKSTVFDNQVVYKQWACDSTASIYPISSLFHLSAKSCKFTLSILPGFLLYNLWYLHFAGTHYFMKITTARSTYSQLRVCPFPGGVYCTTHFWWETLDEYTGICIKLPPRNFTDVINHQIKAYISTTQKQNSGP